MTERTINHNGTFYSAGHYISAHNRAFLYGDSIFETILVYDKVQLWSLHFERLKLASDTLQFEWPVHWNSNYFRNQVVQTVKENRTTRARVRLVMYRNDGGTYMPETNNCSFMISCTRLDTEPYEWNTEGLRVDIYPEMQKYPSLISGFKNGNSILYVLASLDTKKRQLDDALILNHQGRVCESIRCNVFVVKDGKILTPPMTEAPVNGIMRQHLLQLLASSGYSIEEKPLELQDFESADELFLSSSFHGVQWVAQFNDKKYSDTTSKKIHQLLLEHLNK